MKDSLAALLLLSLFLLSCSTSDSDKPKIEIVEVYVDGDDTNYLNKLNRMPLLNVGDRVDIGLDLDGNGNDLRTFMILNQEPALVETTITLFQYDEVSDGFSDLDNGTLGFVDDISATYLTVKAEIKSIAEEKVTLSFCLFSKAPDSKGASVEITLKTGMPEMPDPQK